MVVVHVGAGIERAQRAVQRQRRLGIALLDALADLHLHEVAGLDHALGLLDRAQVVGLGELALGRVRLRGLDHRRTDRILELLLEVAQAPLGIAVGLALARIGIDDQVQLARQVVDHRQFLALQQQDVRAAQRVGRAGCLQLLLDVAHGVVAEIAGQAAAKTRQAGAQRHLETLLVVGDEVERIADVGLGHDAVGDDLGLRLGAKAGGAQQGARRQADEAVAAESLAADDRLQQKAVGAGALGEGQLQVQRQGGFEIGKRLHHQRNAVVALGCQALEFKFGNHASDLSIRQRRSTSQWRSHAGIGVPMAGRRCGGRSGRQTRARYHCGPAVAAGPDENQSARRSSQAWQGMRVTPGPGSPVAATCDADAVNEHRAQCSKAADRSSGDLPGATAHQARQAPGCGPVSTAPARRAPAAC